MALSLRKSKWFPEPLEGNILPDNSQVSSRDDFLRVYEI